MIRSVIIEDEKYPRQVLAKMLGKHCPDVSVVALCPDAQTGIEAIGEHHPDLIFLDIDMPGMNGIEMLRQLDAIDFDIIFTTAHDEYALDAFKVSPVDYLLKPIDEDELVDAVSRAQKRRRAFSTVQLDHLVKSLQHPEKPIRKIAIPSHEAMEFVDLDDVVRCEANRNYTAIFTRQGKTHLYSRTLKEVARLFPNEIFYRVHQSHLINLREVKTYMRGIGGQLILKDGTVIPVARSKKEGLMKRLFEQ